MHEPIIDRATWERVQQKRGKVRKRKTKDGESNMFSGLLICADCGCNLGYHFNQGNPDIRYFNCQNYNKTNRTCSSIHYNCVGTIEIPDFPPLTQPDVTMQTRKGVAVSYALMQNAG